MGQQASRPGRRASKKHLNADDESATVCEKDNGDAGVKVRGVFLFFVRMTPLSLNGLDCLCAVGVVFS